MTLLEMNQELEVSAAGVYASAVYISYAHF